MPAINLLPKDVLHQQKREKQQMLVGSFSTSVLVVVIVVIVGMFGFRVYLNRQYSDVNDQLTDLRARVSDQKTVEGTLQSIHLKIDKIREIFAKNYPYGEILEDLSNRAGDKVKILSVELKNQDNFTVSGKAETLPDLATYAKNVDEASDKYQKVQLTKINFDKEDFKYGFSMEFVYQEPTQTDSTVN
ncbi:hypothetical protein HGA91_04280 [candidate division WWE3 bacterium]|nr:hypothetical protein [candidate division WWE3 bacterium]